MNRACKILLLAIITLAFAQMAPAAQLNKVAAVVNGQVIIAVGGAADAALAEQGIEVPVLEAAVVVELRNSHTVAYAEAA